MANVRWCNQNQFVPVIILLDGEGGESVAVVNALDLSFMGLNIGCKANL